jgi:endonuclease/exonuclease/phosphatase family metal-dependent hydrolase
MLRKILHRILVVVSLVFVFALLLAYLSIYVSPGKFVLPAFFGLAYPYLLLINLFFGFYWIYRKRWSAVIPLFVIVLGWTHFTQYFALGFNAGETITTEMKVMSYNVRYFNRYNWNKDPDAALGILEMIQKEDIDIICFQEFHVRKNEGITLSLLKSKLSSFPYFYIHEKGNLAIFSKYKITQSKDIDFTVSGSATAFYSDIKMGRENVRIFNCHLESNRFKKEDYDFINNLKKNAEEKNIEGARGITRRLAYAFKKRAIQADKMSKLIQDCPYRVIVCGDFNDSPISYSYKKIRGDLNDAFIEKGFGLGSTYIGDFPSYRIDYIFHSDDLECISFKKIKRKYSDHFPIITAFRKDF